MGFSAKVMMKNVRHFKVRLGFSLFIKILLKTAQLLPKHFPSGLSLFITYFLFHKSKDTSAIPQPSVQHLVYVFPIFFHVHKCFDNFHLSKNILQTQPPEVFCKKGVLRNFAKFTGKHLCQNFFLNKAAGNFINKFINKFINNFINKSL